MIRSIIAILVSTQVVLALVVSCKKDVPSGPARPPLGHSASCARASEGYNRFVCDNSVGRWTCDERGCLWQQPLPPNHPLNTAEVPQGNAP